MNELSPNRCVKNFTPVIRAIARWIRSWNPYSGYTTHGLMNRFSSRGTMATPSRPASMRPKKNAPET